jgi:hypothetical protein
MTQHILKTWKDKAVESRVTLTVSFGGHSVQIHDRDVDNIMTLYRLRRASGRPPDCTQYMCYTGRPNSIQ